MPMNTWATFSVIGRVLGRRLVEVGGRVLERAAAGPKQLLDHLVHRHVLGELLDEPVVVEEHRLVADLMVERIWSNSAHLLTQISENSLRSSSSSISLDRRAGSVELMNRLYSSTVGVTPTTSR